MRYFLAVEVLEAGVDVLCSWLEETGVEEVVAEEETTLAEEDVSLVLSAALAAGVLPVQLASNKDADRAKINLDVFMFICLFY